MLTRILRWLFVPPAAALPEATHAPRICPVSGCRRALLADHELCGHHWQLVPAPLAKSLQRARHRDGIGTLAHRRASRIAIAAVEHQLRPSS